MGVDVTIRGAGIFGLSCAWELISLGATVRIVDPHGPGSGSSGGVLGALAPHTPERWNQKKEFQFQSLIYAEGFWSDVANAAGSDPGYARSGRLQPITDERGLDLARQRQIDAAKLWQGKASWDVIPVGEGLQPVSTSGYLVHDSLTARVHPRRGIDAIMRALDANGAEFAKEAPDSGQTIWATGVHGLEDLNTTFSRQIGDAQKGQAALLGFSAPEAPQIFAPGLHVIFHADGTTAVGSTSEREFEHAFSTDKALEDMISAAQELVPALAEAPVLERWAGLRPRAKTRAPILGEWPDRKGHYIANGGFKIGFGMAPLIGRIMADLVARNRDAIPDEFRFRVD